jgi:hypothetical protein
VLDAETSGMFDIEYQFNFCDTVAQRCKGVEASAIEFLDIYETTTDTCEVLGQNQGDKVAYSLIDDKEASKGIMVTMMGGDVCNGSETPSLNGLPRKAMFRLECGEEEDKEVSNFTLIYL